MFRAHFVFIDSRTLQDNTTLWESEFPYLFMMHLKYINYNGQMEVEIIFIYLVFLMFEFVD